MVSTQQLGSAIAEARKKAGLTQDDLSDKANLSYSTLAKIEQGNIKSPSVFTIKAIASALDTSIDTLLKHKPTQIASVKNETPSDIKFVYCDVNGVLVHFFQKAFITIAEETGAKQEVIEATFWHYNEPTNRGKMSLADFNQAMAKRLGIESLDWKKHYMEAIEPINDMRSCLEEIAKKYPVGLLTNIMPGFLDEMFKRDLLPQLEYTSVIDSSKVKTVKPEVAMYEAAEKQSGYDAREIMFIDDSRENLTEAEKLGWHVLWFDDYRPKESIKRIKSILSV